MDRNTERAVKEIESRVDDPLARDIHRRTGRWTDPWQPLKVQGYSLLRLQLRAQFGPVFKVGLGLTQVVVLC
jgi:hypothetical protein